VKRGSKTHPVKPIKSIAESFEKAVRKGIPSKALLMPWMQYLKSGKLQMSYRVNRVGDGLPVIQE
jgi:hypothetical protein